MGDRTPTRTSAAETLFGAGTPSEVLAIAQPILDASNSESNQQRAKLEVSLAGWYRTGRGWRKLSDDLRGKVHVEPAVKQPDGTYTIDNIEIFYPNAVKTREGRTIKFDGPTLERIVQRTNQHSGSGAPAPALTIGHPPELRMTNELAVGRVINLRIHDGRALGTLVKVTPSTVQKWKNHEILGVSAGFTSDAGDLDTRISHVAVLGADPPALSKLRRTDVYEQFSATRHAMPANTLCFSAEPCFFFRGINP